MKLEERAREIAQSMCLKNLKTWHIPTELEMRNIPPMEKEIMIKLVTKELSKLESY